MKQYLSRNPPQKLLVFFHGLVLGKRTWRMRRSWIPSSSSPRCLPWLACPEAWGWRDGGWIDGMTGMGRIFWATTSNKNGGIFQRNLWDDYLYISLCHALYLYVRLRWCCTQKGSGFCGPRGLLGLWRRSECDVQVWSDERAWYEEYSWDLQTQDVQWNNYGCIGMYSPCWWDLFGILSFFTITFQSVCLPFDQWTSTPKP